MDIIEPGICPRFLRAHLLNLNLSPFTGASIELGICPRFTGTPLILQKAYKRGKYEA